MAVVMIIDQQASRGDRDRIPEIVAALNAHASDLLMPFQRTIGDECEGVLGSALDVPRLVHELAIDGRWWIGIGIGTIDGVASDSRDVSGAAFGIAREMVEEAKRRTRGRRRRPWPVRCRGFADAHADDAFEACLASIYMIVEGRSSREHDVARLLSAGIHDQMELASKLMISQPAISKAIGRSHWDEEQALARCAAYIAGAAS